MAEKNISNHYFDNCNFKNPIIKILMKNFYKTLIDAVKKENITSMLDIGCGEGHVTNILKTYFEKNNQNVNIVGLDYDQQAVLCANRIYPSLNIKQGNILNLSKKYDLLISTEVLEHIEDFETAIKNCKKVSPICVFSVPNEPWFRIANIFRLKYLKKLGNTPGHVNNWSKKEFYQLLKKHFKCVKIRTTGLWNVVVCKKPIITKSIQ